MVSFKLWNIKSYVSRTIIADPLFGRFKLDVLVINAKDLIAADKNVWGTRSIYQKLSRDQLRALREFWRTEYTIAVNGMIAITTRVHS